MPAEANEARILVLAPARRDGPAVAEILAGAGLASELYPDLEALCRAMAEGSAGAALIAEEGLLAGHGPLTAWLASQPPWSDLPIIIVAAGGQHGAGGHALLLRRFQELGNVLLLERPLRAATLVTTMRSALRARRRQYQVRDEIAEREGSEERLRQQERQLRQLAETLEERVRERTRALEDANQRLRAEMHEREEIERALRQAQKMEAIGQLTGGIAHDFNNLLAAVLGNLELIGKRHDGHEPTQRLVQSATRAAERGAALTERLLAFARKQHLRPEPVDLKATVGGMRELLERTLGGAIRIDVALQSDLWPALADATQIELVILNLAINARDAMPVGGKLLIEATNVPDGSERPPDLGAGDFVRLALTDTGTGMTEEVLAKAFEPFFTTKQVGKGSGLGLSQVYGVATQFGGGVRMRSRLGAGTTVEVFLPRTDAASAARPQGEPEPVGVAAAAARTTVLLADDDPDVREFVVAGLQGLGYDVVAAANGQAALEILEGGEDRRVSLLLVDYAMPGITGTELAKIARNRRPDLPVVFITGYAELGEGEDFADAVWLKKPFKLAILAATLERALRRARLRQTGGNVLPLNPPRRG